MLSVTKSQRTRVGLVHKLKVHCPIQEIILSVKQFCSTPECSECTLSHLSFPRVIDRAMSVCSVDSEFTNKQLQELEIDVLILRGTVDWAWSADDSKL